VKGAFIFPANSNEKSPCILYTYAGFFDVIVLSY